MGAVGVLWAGKRLTTEEELQLRRAVALLQRMETSDAGLTELRMNLERFLPENDHRWTPNELETGTYLGPWMVVRGQLSDRNAMPGSP